MTNTKTVEHDNFAVSKYGNGTIFSTLRLHKYKKVNMYPLEPKHNMRDFASRMRESMKA